jgi:transposase-like protein
MGEALRKRRHGIGRSSGQSWYADETYLKVHGRWCYLYRAIDRDGNLIDTMLSATRDMKAARRFFRSARSVAGFVPDRVTTDGHNSYPRTIRSTLGRNVRHGTSVYLNNRLEQDHRGIKGRIRCMRSFKAAALSFQGSGAASTAAISVIPGWWEAPHSILRSGPSSARSNGSVSGRARSASVKNASPARPAKRRNTPTCGNGSLARYKVIHAASRMIANRRFR